VNGALSTAAEKAEKAEKLLQSKMKKSKPSISCKNYMNIMEQLSARV